MQRQAEFEPNIELNGPRAARSHAKTKKAATTPVQGHARPTSPDAEQAAGMSASLRE